MKVSCPLGCDNKIKRLDIASHLGKCKKWGKLQDEPNKKVVQIINGNRIEE